MDNVIITSVNFYTYDIPLNQSLRISGNTMSARQGAILVLTDSKGHTGCGEISPLPGLHSETLPEIVEYFIYLKNYRPGEVRTNENTFLSDMGIESSNQWNRWPSVRFGVTSALADLNANNLTRPVCELWPGNPKVKTININALITREDDYLSQIQFLREAGYTSVKVKVGNNDLAGDIDRIHKLRMLLGPETAIRIDANCSWGYPEAHRFIESVADTGFEYIEEPLKNAADIPRLINKLRCPVALDESLPAWRDRTSVPDGIAALIIKPSVVGSVDENLRWIDFARQKNIKAVISDTFHSGVGMRMLLNMAVYAGGDYTAMGLDTYRWLSRDVLEKRLPLPAGRINPDELSAAHGTLNFDALKKIF